MINENILVYSAVVGEIPSMVRNKQAECFVKWEDYIELKNYAEELESKLKNE